MEKTLATEVKPWEGVPKHVVLRQTAQPGFVGFL